MSFLFDTLDSGFDAVLDIIIDIIIWFIEILPEGGTIPSEVGEGLNTAWSFALGFDFLIPFSILPDILIAFIAFETALFTWKIIGWIAGLIAN